MHLESPSKREKKSFKKYAAYEAQKGVCENCQKLVCMEHMHTFAGNIQNNCKWYVYKMLKTVLSLLLF